ncbi:hypothetical protein Pelo_19181 [Pelomyxa schiedti]|nr:hypothetical protein Pelo_19181 [Pelomyxa schiedti]
MFTQIVLNLPDPIQIGELAHTLESGCTNSTTPTASTTVTTTNGPGSSGSGCNVIIGSGDTSDGGGVAAAALRVHAQISQAATCTPSRHGRVISSDVWVMSPAAYSQAPGTIAFADRMSPGMHLHYTVLLIPNYNHDDRRKAGETVVQSFGPSGSSIASGRLPLLPVAADDSCAIADCVNAVRKDDGDDDSRHMAAVCEVARLTIETVGSTLCCIGLAAQLALSLSSTCSCLRRVCDADTLWHTLFLSHLPGGALTVSLSHPEYSGTIASSGLATYALLLFSLRQVPLQ